MAKFNHFGPGIEEKLAILSKNWAILPKTQAKEVAELLQTAQKAGFLTISGETLLQDLLDQVQTLKDMPSAPVPGGPQLVCWFKTLKLGSEGIILQKPFLRLRLLPPNFGGPDGSLGIWEPVSPDSVPKEAFSKSGYWLQPSWISPSGFWTHPGGFPVELAWRIVQLAQKPVVFLIQEFSRTKICPFCHEVGSALHVDCFKKHGIPFASVKAAILHDATTPKEPPKPAPVSVDTMLSAAGMKPAAIGKFTDFKTYQNFVTTKVIEQAQIPFNLVNPAPKVQSVAPKPPACATCSDGRKIVSAAGVFVACPDCEKVSHAS